MLDQRLIDQIIESNDIVNIVEQYLPLKKAGTNFKACCPFHDEKTPSFVVSDKKQIFKCFGCGKGGNVIHFVKEIENITFFEALEKLAARGGIQLKSKDKTQKKKESRQNLLLKVYELAKDHYKENLNRFGEHVLRYLESRGISAATCRKFELGYALNSSAALHNYLLKCEINKNLLENSGLFTHTLRGNLDLFRDRLIFPIHSANGNVVAFGARLLSDSSKIAKYVNSPTTDLYTKGKELYGFYLTKNEIRKLDYALVTEGYTDFLRLFEEGFGNSVATLGTAFTDDQIKLLNRYSSNIYLLFDADTAGRKAAVKAAGNIIISGANPRIISLPEGEDADNFFKNHSKEEFRELIAKARTLTEYLYHSSNLALNQKGKLETILEIANDITDELNRELLLKETANIFSVSVSALSKRIRTRRTSRKETQVYKTVSNPSLKHNEEKTFLIYLINGLIEDPKELQDIDSGYFFQETYKKVFESLTSLGYIIDNDRIASLLAELEENDSMQVKIISELSLADIPPVSYQEIICDLKIRKFKNELRNLDRYLSEEENQSTIISRKKELLEKIRNLSHKVIP
jgi:DNA primase